MKKKLYTVAVASLAATAVAVAPAAAADTFSDVKKDNAHYEAITALHTAGVISGYPDGTFKPAKDVTRGQAAKMIAGALGLDTKNVENPKLADLPKTHQYYGPIAALAELGAIEYYVDDNTVAPNEAISRGEFIFMLATGLGIEEEIEVEDADATITRGEVASFIYETLSEEAEEETTTEDSATVEQTTADAALLETVFTKAAEKQLATESLKAAITMAQSMVIQDGEEAVTVDANIKMDMSIVNKPMAFFAEGTVAMVEPTTGEAIEMPIKMYMTEKDGMYVYEGLTKTWVKYPTEMFDEILAQTGAQINAAEQLEMLKKFATDFKIKEEGNHYILSLTGAGDKFTELVQEQMGALNLGLDEEALAEIKNMKFDTFTYDIKINKETFDIEEMVMNFGFGMKAEGITMDVTNKSTIKYTDYNSVSTITIPEEVLKNAKTFEELDLSAIEETEAK